MRDSRVYLSGILIFLLLALVPVESYAKYRYYHFHRKDHTAGETIGHLSFIYGINIGLYVATQYPTIRDHGSFQKYRKNFGRVVLYDSDSPFFNWMVHPYSGSQIYLYYRARGYSQVAAFQLTALQSLLFEMTIEVYTEPASFEDIFNTPVIGGVVGLAFEVVSISFLNSDSTALNIIGHILNPATLFGFHEGRVLVTPQVSSLEKGGLGLGLTIRY